MTQTSNAPILEGRNLTKAFGGLVAVHNVSLAVQPGTVHAIIGPNGAGKTTLFNLLSGVLRPSRGQVLLRGHDVTRTPLHMRPALGVGRSFQITNVFPNLTVLENVRLAVQARGRHSGTFWRRVTAFPADIARATDVLDQVGLARQALLPANTLPHGGKRKLELALLLAADPQVLLLDEPTAGMASEQVPDLLALIARVREGRTVVLVEHNMRVVMDLSDTITVMHHGAVIAEGTPAAIAANATVQQVYLGGLYGDLMAAGAHTAEAAS